MSNLEDLQSLLDHYDKNGRGYIDNVELFALISDIMRKDGNKIDANKVLKIKEYVMAVCDRGNTTIYQ